MSRHWAEKDYDEDDLTDNECEDEDYFSECEEKYRSTRPTIAGPSIIEAEKYPALGEAWDRLIEEYEVIRKLTLGK